MIQSVFRFQNEARNCEEISILKFPKGMRGVKPQFSMVKKAFVEWMTKPENVLN